MLDVMEGDGIKKAEIELTPAISYSSDNYAVFFYADTGLFKKLGQCVQGLPGRINMTPLTYRTYHEKDLLLPNLSVEPAGRINISATQHEVYCGMDEIARFFKVHPHFEIYRQYIGSIIGSEKDIVESLESRLSA